MTPMTPKEDRVIRFDWALKYILRDKANFDILEGFLTALLKEEMTIIQILESEADRSLEHLKYNRVDILVEDSQGRQLIIEIQNQHEADYLYRLLFGTSKVIVDTLQIGQPYQAVKKVISISILYFNFGSGDDYIYHGSTRFIGLHTRQPLEVRQRMPNQHSYTLRTVNIEREIFPEYYLIQVERFTDIINSPFDEWIYMLKHERLPDHFQAKNIDRAREKLTLLKMDEVERRQYERYLMNLASERDILETRYQEGHKVGRREAVIETARNLLAMGLSIEQIIQATGLSAAELDRIDTLGDNPVESNDV